MRKMELSKAEARKLAAGLIDYAEGRVKSLDEIEREIEIGECGELPLGANTAGIEATKPEFTTPPLSNEHSPINSVLS